LDHEKPCDLDGVFPSRALGSNAFQHVKDHEQQKSLEVTAWRIKYPLVHCGRSPDINYANRALTD
jgi:hypothetical protein